MKATAAMGLSLGLLVVLLGQITAVGLAMEAPVMLSDDAIARPPVHQVITSPAKTYTLVLQADETWTSKQLTATLYGANGTACEPEWSKTLPQEYGPRFVIVTDQGNTVLLDEWINVASDYAVMVLDPAGQPVAQHSFDDVVQVLQMSRADIVDNARHGWWISREPRLSRNGQTVQVGAAGKRLQIDVTSGEMGL